MSASSTPNIDAATIHAYIHGKCTDELQRAEVEHFLVLNPELAEALSARAQNNGDDAADLSVNEIEELMKAHSLRSAANRPAGTPDKELLKAVRDRLADKAPSANAPAGHELSQDTATRLPARG